MMAEKEEQNCCFCLSVSSGGSIIDSDILELLKFITEDLDINALENSTACDDCLNRIVAANDYKTKNSFKMIVDTNIEEIGSKCQMCDKICEQDETLQLGNCVTQIDWSDFVNYLFTDGDTKSLENSQLCDSCYVSVSNIQNFLKLLCKYDRSTIIYGDSEAKDDKNLLELKVEVKQEIENLVEDQIEIMSSHNEVDDNINCNNFECKNEVDVKVESDNDDDIHTFERVDVKEIITSSGDVHVNSYNKEEDNVAVKNQHNAKGGIKDNSGIIECQQCKNNTHKKYIKSSCGVKSRKKYRVYKCTQCSKQFSEKATLDNHVLKSHNCRNVTNKIYDCDKCSFATIKKQELFLHSLKHGIGDNLEVYKCYQCSYQTYYKNAIRSHIRKKHNTSFNCTLCLKKCKQKSVLDNHLLLFHKSKDNVTSKVYECDKCDFATSVKKLMLKHNIRHEIKESSRIDKHQPSTSEICNIPYINTTDLKVHKKIQIRQRYECSFCLNELNDKPSLDDHLIKIHNYRKNINRKIYECDKCSYATIRSHHIRRHNLIHGIKDNYHISYTRQDGPYVCIFCSKELTDKQNLDDHLVKIHNYRTNIRSKIYECDKCSYATIRPLNLDRHKLRHVEQTSLRNYRR